ncbi:MULTISPECIES: nuclear transport factor 2 family protein [unclassified Acinetobacter]|uniref:nuclear transport factor 2 family protein n=1 Tax=unclassified Acinetobacter TaxID=196816 RepID=UPI0029349AEE|nr:MULTISPECIES: nuclear transport factor 2 family protein [unclassified Acinetobacter]WOE32426.1 nuclear transport factor 2 family protein [Acinetobacter sp. SAAs470]WOE37900.1 nuclear transport factor 2 family protein [Acinetobacter sp. SAAs474]
MNSIKKVLSIALTFPLLSLLGCKSTPSYSSDYAQARNRIQGVNLDANKAQEIGLRFTSAFNTLGTDAFINNATNLYDHSLFINDTLSQFNSKNQLITHFKAMNQRVKNVSVELLNTSFHHDSAYVHWYMRYDFKFLGSTRRMASYGISEIKINTDGKIIFQQDFWDPANGLYRSLPYAGGIYSWLLPFKKSS